MEMASVVWRHQHVADSSATWRGGGEDVVCKQLMAKIMAAWREKWRKGVTELFVTAKQRRRNIHGGRAGGVNSWQWHGGVALALRSPAPGVL